MKMLIAACFLLSLSVMASDEYSVNIEKFNVQPPKSDLTNKDILPKIGNCYLRAMKISEKSHLISVHVIESGDVLAGEEEALLVENGRLKLSLGYCGKASGYKTTVTSLNNGSKKLEASCKGNGLQGEGSSKLELVIDGLSQVSSIKLSKRAGWWENFRRVDLDCQF